MENTEIKIEKNVPIPDNKKKGRKAMYPFHIMNVGDSFFVDDTLPRSLYQTSRTFANRNSLDWKFKAYKEGENGTRIWRIK